MKKVMIVNGYNISEFEDDINLYFKDGYELKGEIKLVYDNDFKDVFMCQVMVKEYEE